MSLQLDFRSGDTLRTRFSISLFLLAVGVRLYFLSLTPFSTDTGRFLSDGQTLLEGKNPYNSAPTAAIEYAHLRSFYPPLQEAFFAISAYVYARPITIKLAGGLFELAFVFWYIYRKRRRPKSAWPILFLLFNPLSLHEVWREGHLDHIAAILLFFAMVNLRPRFASSARRARGALYAVLSICWKFTGILAVAMRYPKRASSAFVRIVQTLVAPFTLFCAVVFALQIAPAFLFTAFAERGLTVYANYWHHGNGIVHLLESFGFSAAHAVYLVQRAIVLLFLLVGVLYVLRRIQYLDAFWFALGSLVVFFPVQHPWYYFLLFPAILLSPRWRGPFMLLCTLAPLSYLGYAANFKSFGFWIITLTWGVATVRNLRRVNARLLE